jgi:guanosine-3',5'-bis(diphosphate) 3'-pyrophosphohydrolase
MNLILSAAAFAAKAHDGQRRKWMNTPYILHPARVAGRMSIHPIVLNTEPFLGESYVAGMWLHDVVEDTKTTFDELTESGFNDIIVGICRDLYNPSKNFPGEPREIRKEMDREHLRGLDRPAQIGKLLDRIDNVRETWRAPMDFVELYCHESQLLAATIGSADLELRDELLAAIEETKNLAQILGEK